MIRRARQCKMREGETMLTGTPTTGRAAFVSISSFRPQWLHPLYTHTPHIYLLPPNTRNDFRLTPFSNSSIIWLRSERKKFMEDLKFFEHQKFVGGKERPVLAFHSWPLIFRENCRRDLFILNEWNSIGTLFASWECVCFKKTNWIFFTIATGMEVIFCLLSINAIPHPSRKSLVSSKPCCIFPPLLLLTWIKRTRKKVFFFVFAGRSSSPVELQLVGPNYPKARLSLSPSFCIFPRSSSERNPITKSIFKLSFYSFFFFFLQILMGT